MGVSVIIARCRAPLVVSLLTGQKVALEPKHVKISKLLKLRRYAT